jgi:outer membrane lipoprotein-sorting protein
LNPSANRVTKNSKLVATFVAIGLTCQLFVSAATGTTYPVLEDHNKYTSDLLSGMKWLNGQTFLESAHDTANAFDDYVVETRLTGKLRDALKEGNGKFFYKRHRRVRVEVTKGTVNQGSVLVQREDGVIQGRGGGLLRFVKLTLQPDSRMLVLPSGDSVVKADLPTLLADVVDRLKKGSKARVASDEVTGKLWRSPVKIVEVGDASFATISDRIYMNPKTNVPVEWDVYKNGILVSITYFDNFKGNIGLDDKLFDL